MMDRVTRGQRRHLVSLFGPGVPVPDGDGGYTVTPIPLAPPTRNAEIKPATARDMERVAAGTTLSTATQIMTMDYHAGITTKTVATWVDARGGSHTANVSGVSNPEERCIDSVLVCVEVVQ